MATLEVGEVTVDDDGQPSGTGLALDLFNADAEARAEFFELLPSLGFPEAAAPDPDVLWAKMAAIKANKLAAVIVIAIFNGIDD